MTNASSTQKKFFLNKRFFIYVKRASRAQVEKSAELIKLFGGQIDQFLDTEVSYVLTDVPKQEWPPAGRDSMLERALAYKVKLMSLQDLLVWCSRYITSHSSSDDDDEIRAHNNDLVLPYIKFEDFHGHFAPGFKEFQQWPECYFNYPIPLGNHVFREINSVHVTERSSNHVRHPNNSAQITQQAMSAKTATANLTGASAANPVPVSQPTPKVCQSNHNGLAKPRVTPDCAMMIELRPHKKHGVFCEICGSRFLGNIDEHIQSQEHKDHTVRLNWDEVNSVIKSLPSLSTLNMRRLTNLTMNLDHQEFLCLHNVDSVSQLFNQAGAV